MNRDQAVNLVTFAKALLPKTEDAVCVLLADFLEPLTDPDRAREAIAAHATSEHDTGHVRLPRLVRALNEGSD